MTEMSQWPLQVAVLTHLAADTTLTALLAAGEDSLHDHVPAGSALPYVVIGDMRERPDDTQAGGATETTMTLLAYTRTAGMKAVREIAAALKARLHNQTFTVPGHWLVLCQMTGAETTLESDGITRRAALTFRLVTEPV